MTKYIYGLYFTQTAFDGIRFRLYINMCLEKFVLSEMKIAILIEHDLWRAFMQ